jgi:hypothetical protein
MLCQITIEGLIKTILFYNRVQAEEIRVEVELVAKLKKQKKMRTRRPRRPRPQQ